MPAPVIFKDLPATFPETDRYKKRSVVSSIVFHGSLILGIVVIPLLLPQALPKHELFVTMIAPLPPPPPMPAPAVQPAVTARKTESVVRPVAATETLLAPTAIPKVVVPIVEAPAVPSSIGVVGGMPGGLPGGVLGGVLGANSNVAPPPPLAAAPLLPPPPPPSAPAMPAGPIRVGGVVKEPRPVKMVPPVYPPLASRARVSGVVVLEATLTTDGTVAEIHVVSGHPLLTDAAIRCVKQWRYEPTLLNGTPVAVILTARVRFDQATAD
jgi:periplasmic protein TonB